MMIKECLQRNPVDDVKNYKADELWKNSILSN